MHMHSGYIEYAPNNGVAIQINETFAARFQTQLIANLQYNYSKWRH